MLKLVCNVLIIGVSVLFSSANLAQKTKSPMNDHPNPYTTINGYFDLPGDRVWGATGAIDISPDGESIWVAERCGTNSCAGSDIDPVVNFDQAGNVIRTFGAGLGRTTSSFAVLCDKKSMQQLKSFLGGKSKI